MNQINRDDGSERHIFLYRSTLIYKTSSSYQTIYVTERNEFDGMRGKFRMLQFSSDAVQGIINLEQPQLLVASGYRIVVDLIDHYAFHFQNGFIIGHGIGTISSYYSNKHLFTAEIDPLVVEVSKKYFGHTGKNVELGDGQALLKTQKAQSQDIIFLDAFSGSEIPLHLTTKEFFSLTNDKLSDKGIFIMNYIGKIKNDELFHTLYSTISSIYPSVKLFVTEPMKRSNQNIFFVASRRVLENYSPREATLLDMPK
ncbi:fused MFS/spermidine synthase [Paenibacillus sp. BSR1-1]|uniref:spermidine synthase n=1 Tax=Paenibacillus sp. BSR1-1 TaxID=3020845 RepID=UPI0025B11195|nr:fused MFS/spermidine synthase [Paenibacillus sp. BSR1-1]MDN3015360.1 fused MFS/spermidine synthase [Paenibacillus sp. BSR1-1]